MSEAREARLRAQQGLSVLTWGHPGGDGGRGGQAGARGGDGCHVDGVGGEGGQPLDLVLSVELLRVSVSREALCPYTSQET